MAVIKVLIYTDKLRAFVLLLSVSLLAMLPPEYTKDRRLNCRLGI